MTKISSKTAYPKKKPISSDYFVGTDSEDFNKTVNFGFEEVAGLVNKLNGTPLLNYLFSTSPYLSTEVLLEGRFLSDENELSTPSLTKLHVNKFNNSGDNLQELYLFLQANATDFYLKLRNSNNQNNAVYFDIASIEDFPDYFILNITVFKENEFLPLLENLNVYFFDFELKATSAGTSDPLKLDKDGYTGTAKDIDDRVIALESLQNLSTNFIGQAYAVWTGEGLIYDVIYPNYYIEGVSYFGATEQIILDAADPTNPRQDVIAVGVTGAIKKTGVASPDPAAPSVDTQTEIYISTIFIGAGATTPTGVSNTDIYKENIEFVTSTNLGTVNFNSLTFPFSGTKCIDIGAFTPTKYLRFSGVDSLEISDFSTLQLFLYLKASFATTAKLSFRFINGTTPVSSIVLLNNNQYNYNRTVVQVYQNIVIPISAFTFWSGTFTGIEIFTEGNNASGCKIDNISLQKGGAFSSPKQKALTSIITDSGVANATTEDDTFTLKGGNGASVSAVGKVITITPASEVVNTITNGDTTHSPSGDVVFDALALKANLLDAILLTGTTPSNPVSGEIEVLETAKGIWSKGGSYPDDYSGIFLGEGSSGLYFRNLFDNNEVSIRTYDSGVVISDNRLTAIGLSGAQNFSPNITDLDYPQKIYVDTGLSSKLDASAYNQYFKGVYLTLAALIAAHPTGVAGDSAQVNEVGATDVINYSWDAEENIWVAGGGTGGAANTDALPEGSTNLYHTTARVLATLLTGISFATGGAIVSTDSVLAAFGKIQKQITDALTAIGLKQDTLVSGTNIKTLDGDSLLGSGNLLPKTELAYALADETANLTVSTRIKFRMPHAMTLSEVRISLNDAPTISSVIVDVKENGVSIFSTLLSIDASEKTSVTAATPAVISDINLADDAEITVSTTQIGSGDTGKGLKILFKGRKA